MAEREKGSLGLLKGMVFSINFKEMTQYSCIEDRGVWLEVVLVSISASSYVAFIDKALVAKANRYLRPSSLFSLGTMDSANRSITMLL